MSAIERSCYRYKGHLIPGCWAAALNTGPCTCARGPSRKELEEEVSGLKARVAALERLARHDKPAAKPRATP